MADIDEELRAAIGAYLRDSKGGESFPLSLQLMVDVFTNGDDWILTKMFRMFHDKCGHYPTFEELNPPGAPVAIVGPIPDI